LIDSSLPRVPPPLVFFLEVLRSQCICCEVHLQVVALLPVYEDEASAVFVLALSS